MKHLLSYLFVFIALVACSDAAEEIVPEEPKTQAEIKVETSSLSFSSDGGQSIISFTSTKSWTAEVSVAAKDWCSIDIEKGNGGSVKVEVSVTSNENVIEERTAFVVIKSGSISKSVKIAQDALFEDVYEADRAGLIALYEALDGDNWTNNENWCSDRPLEEWEGVIVDYYEGYVTELLLRGNNVKGEIPDEVRYLTNLEYLQMGDNEVSYFNIGNMPNLKILECSNNPISSLDLSQNPKLEKLYIAWTEVSSLDFSNNPDLVAVNCGGTKIKNLDFSHNPKLYSLQCHNCNIESLNLSKNQEMQYINFSSCGFASIDVSNFPKLRDLHCGWNNFETIDLSNNPELVSLSCGNSNLNSLDVSNNPLLESLYCASTKLTTLDLTNNSALTMLDCLDCPDLVEIYVKKDHKFQVYNADPHTELVYVE